MALASLCSRRPVRSLPVDKGVPSNAKRDAEVAFHVKQFVLAGTRGATSIPRPLRPIRCPGSAPSAERGASGRPRAGVASPHPRAALPFPSASVPSDVSRVGLLSRGFPRPPPSLTASRAARPTLAVCLSAQDIWLGRMAVSGGVTLSGSVRGAGGSLRPSRRCCIGPGSCLDSFFSFGGSPGGERVPRPGHAFGRRHGRFALACCLQLQRWIAQESWMNPVSWPRCAGTRSVRRLLER